VKYYIKRNKNIAGPYSVKQIEAGIRSGKFRWGVWAMPRTEDGEVDHHAALTGDDLIDFVNGKLFPYLAKFKTAAEILATVLPSSFGWCTIDPGCQCSLLGGVLHHYE
jgi:type I restriction enzyme M protein